MNYLPLGHVRRSDLIDLIDEAWMKTLDRRAFEDHNVCQWLCGEHHIIYSSPC